MTAPSQSTELVTQQHGGALRTAGTPGNVGGPGHASKELRQRIRGSFANRVQVLEEIADSKEYEAADRIRAVDTLGKYGLGVNAALDDSTGTDGARQSIVIGSVVIAF